MALCASLSILVTDIFLISNFLFDQKNGKIKI